MVTVLCLGLAWLFYRQEQLPVWPLAALLAISPYLILFGCRTFSEVFFTAWLLGTFLLARREGLTMAILAALCGGCAYLSRTAGLPLIVAVPAWYLWKRQRGQAVAFAATMLPFILGWMLWSRTHLLHTSDPTLIYYTDYFKYERLNVGLDNLHIVVWHNVDELLYRFGVLVLPSIFDGRLIHIFTQMIGVGMIAGIVRLARRGIAVPYALFAALFSAILLVWHGIDERLVLPLYPLLIAGLFAELQHLYGAVRKALGHKDRSQRVVAAMFASLIAIVCLIALGIQAYLSFKGLDDDSASDRQQLIARREAYRWIADNLPPAALILSNDDPLLYLYTGHQGNGVFPLMRELYYGDKKAAILTAYRNVVPDARRRGLQYFYSSPNDLGRWASDAETAAEVQALVHSNPDLQPVFSNGSGTLYKITP